MKLFVRILFATIVTIFWSDRLYADDIIAVETENTGLYLINDNGILKQLYYGDKVQDKNEFSLMKNMSLEVYPFYGTGNFNENAAQIIHSDGNITSSVKYVSHYVESFGDYDKTSILLKDQYYSLEVGITFTAYKSSDVITMSVTVVNNESGPVQLGRLMSGSLNLRGDRFYLCRLYGTQGYEANFIEEEILQGTKVIESNRGVRNTHFDNPSFMISMDNKATENSGRVYGGLLCWTGNFRMSYQKDCLGNCFVASGSSDFAGNYIVAQGMSYTTPLFAMTYSGQGKGPASRNIHEWARTCVIREPDRVRPIVLNSWEGVGMNFTERQIEQMIKKSADLGVEVFVLDDGWFGNEYPRNDESQGLGDWQCNKKKLPGGLSNLISVAKENGIGFGIWVEPEMVNVNSMLAQEHPSWIVSTDKRDPLLCLSRMKSQQLLDLTNNEVKDFVFSVVDSILTLNPGISYVKWDANRYAPDHGISSGDTRSQNNFWVDYVNGLYDVLDRLQNKYPSVFFQACASGGGRMDYGLLKYCHEAWISDNTDALSRVYMQWGLSHFFPAYVMAAHVSATPNHTTNREIPLKMRLDVAMSARFGIELDPLHLSESEDDCIKKGISEYKKIREVVQFGDLYRLASPYDGCSQIMYVDKAKERAVVFAYVTEPLPYEKYNVVRFEGLDPESKYSLVEINKDIFCSREISASLGKVYSGDFLMKNGIRLNLNRQYQSAVIELKKIN